jgi:hypothetical protein
MLLYQWKLSAWAMYVPGMFDVRVLMVERCGVLIGVGVSAATVE